MTRHALVAVLAAAAVLGCGGRASAPAGEPGARDMADFLDRAVAFARCMRREGQPIPDPRRRAAGESGYGAIAIDPGDRGDPAFEAAARRCEREAPTDVPHPEPEASP